MSAGALILGASSGIGKAVARRLAIRGTPLILAGRDAEDLERTAADLRVRYGVEAQPLPFDATDYDGHPAFFESCLSRLDGSLAGVVLCHGDMADQAEAQRDFALARRMIDVNFTSAVSVLERAAEYLQRRGGGYICGVSSVAGDRGRQSNYLYGSTKAALSAYLQGLRNRLARSGVAVVIVKPGFVDTAMTWGLLKPGSPLVADPDRVAADICRAIDRRRDQIYTPWFWRWIMLIIRGIPEPIFKRMKL
jgi:short-subunit dehydrogenase